MTVYLVGAGPGDPDLLTRRGARLLAQADVVVYDRLTNPLLLAETRTGALLIDVGKHPRNGGPSTSQEAINELLVTHGRQGECVVRLKGGDPFVFGRGGEEVEALHAAGVPVEVVPGVSSALSVPALAGVPVTHRGSATSVTIATGHDVDAVEWRSLASVTGTLVLLMAVANRGAIARRLISSGLSPTTPVAVIESGSTPVERRRTTTLGDLGDLEVDAPAVIVVGAVATHLRQRGECDADETLGASRTRSLRDR